MFEHISQFSLNFKKISKIIMFNHNAIKFLKVKDGILIRRMPSSNNNEEQIVGAVIFFDFIYCKFFSNVASVFKNDISKRVQIS